MIYIYGRVRDKIAFISATEDVMDAHAIIDNEKLCWADEGMEIIKSMQPLDVNISYEELCEMVMK